MTKKQSGFTIVELLIVIVVIGTLAAMVIVAYTGITSSASDSAVKSNLANLVKQMEVSKTLHSENRYPTVDTEFYALQGGVKLTKNSYDPSVTNNVLICFKSDGSGYGIVAASKSTTRYYVSSAVTTPTQTAQVLTGTTSSICSGIGITASSYRWLYSSGAWNSNVSG